MKFADFVRFPEQQEIGRDLTDEQLCVFFDNGQDVGLWREDRRTTVGEGEVLSPHDAEMARSWYRQQKARREQADPARGPAL